MSSHRYPVATLSSDYLRVAVGLALTLGPLLLLDLAPVVAWFLALLAVLFAWFGLRTFLRQQSTIELEPDGVAIRGPFGGEVAWRDLARLKLAYYAPRSWSTSRRRDRTPERDEHERQRGWLQLTLQAATGRPIRIESTLDGFDQVLRRALAAATSRQIALDPTTTANLTALGLDRSYSGATGLTPAASDHHLAPTPGPGGSA